MIAFVDPDLCIGCTSAPGCAPPYSDMEGDPAHYAALCLAARGIMQGERIGDCAFSARRRP